MPKILISFLGTGSISKDGVTSQREYRKAKYSIDDKLIGESSFVSSILMDYFEYDGLILIGTVKSMWEEAYRYFCEKNGIKFDEDYYFNLADKIENANHKTDTNILNLIPIKEVLGTNSDAIIIPYGLDRQEQLQILSIIGEAFKKLESGDEISLDITHSFRSLPLFGTTVINFIHSLSDKNIQFSKVYYGMLDAMREFDGVAPIIDISTTVELQNWITAAYSFKEYGKGALLADLLGGDEGKVIQIFSDAVNINYLNEIKQKLTNFKDLANQNFENEFARWVVPEVLNSFTQRLFKAGNEQYRFQYELSVWHREKQNYASAYIVFTEAVITYVCEKEKLEWNKKENRNDAKLMISQKDVYGLRKLYETANKARNNIAHNLNKRVNQLERDILNLEILQKEFIKLVK
ncbi:MAG: TIGR02221 family CRISPR-associated protein [Chitinophagales bacterium]|nr:TIGR02221 family CRISPR-associated protein [Chitinophagales bacterium]